MSRILRGLAVVLGVSAAACALPACGNDTYSFPTSTSTSTASGTATSSGTGSGGAGGETTSATGTSTSTGSGEMCPAVGDSCTGCESASCPQLYCDCYNDSECVLMAACLAKCAPGDEACDQICWTAHPSAISRGALLLDCAGTTCAKGCPGYAPLGACLVCVYTDCQAEMNTCISKPACTQLLACVSACTDPMCETSCYQKYPEGSAAAGPVANCLQAKCAAPCAP